MTHFSIYGISEHLSTPSNFTSLDKNLERIKKRDREWSIGYREKNRERIRKRQREYYLKNRDKVREIQRQYYQKRKLLIENK